MSVRIPNCMFPEHATLLRKMGVMVPEVPETRLEGEGTWLTVTAPPGWTEGRHPHYCYTTIVDERGFMRVMIFNKRTHYESRLGVYTISRAISGTRHRTPKGLWKPRIVLGHKWVLWEGRATTFDKAGNAEQKRLKKFPDHRSIDAYWGMAIPKGAPEHLIQP